MHRMHLRVVAPEPRVRPAKVIALDARRKARLIEGSKRRPKPAA
jgi:hypothetical protein